MTDESKTVIVFGASRPVEGDAEYEVARTCGWLLAAAGIEVVTGGYGGSMEGASRGAAEAGGVPVGVTAPTVFPGRTGANAFVGREEPAASLTERIHRMMEMADGTIALPGSIGTLTELMVAWNVAYVARFSATPVKPVVTVGEQWQRIIPTLAGQLSTDPDLVSCFGTVEEAVAHMVERLGHKPGAP